MTFRNQEELTEFCMYILESGYVRGRVVLLCEGSRKYTKKTRRSPSSLKAQKDLPDCNFYRHFFSKITCFPCGDRKSVLKTFFRLKELIEQAEPKEYFLNPDKLFAIVDLDIQSEKINDLNPNYPFSDTEAIFCDLYQENKLNHENALNHKIFVTGLIHKEAHFLVPELQPAFDKYSPRPSFQNSPLDLKAIYKALAESLPLDKNLEDNFGKAVKRIKYCKELDITSIKTLQRTIIENLQTHKIINALLTISSKKYNNPKSYWEKIEPLSNDSKLRPHQYREDLLQQAIVNFYNEQSEDSQLHIPALIRVLKALS